MDSHADVLDAQYIHFPIPVINSLRITLKTNKSIPFRAQTRSVPLKQIVCQYCMTPTSFLVWYALQTKPLVEYTCTQCNTRQQVNALSLPAIPLSRTQYFLPLEIKYVSCA